VIFVAFILSLIGVSTTALAEEEKGFAEEKVVLQISDGDPTKQMLILNVANNLIKHYGPDQVAIEIVAFGPGLRLLFKDNENESRIQSLAVSGVKFSACSNTIEAMAKQLGHPPELNSNAVKVSAGVVRILELEHKGYNLVKP
jgi:intracellular sulfur oxidation DsrE/DsrF family protein